MSKSGEHNMVQQWALMAETIRKENRLQKLHTEFSVNPYRKLHVLPDKPLCRNPPEVFDDNPDYMQAIIRARQVPTEKYSMPQTSSQELGWWPASYVLPKRDDRMFNFHRVSTDITKLK